MEFFESFLSFYVISVGYTTSVEHRNCETAFIHIITSAGIRTHRTDGLCVVRNHVRGSVIDMHLWLFSFRTTGHLYQFFSINYPLCVVILYCFSGPPDFCFSHTSTLGGYNEDECY